MVAGGEEDQQDRHTMKWADTVGCNSENLTHEPAEHAPRYRRRRNAGVGWRGLRMCDIFFCLSSVFDALCGKRWVFMILRQF